MKHLIFSVCILLSQISAARNFSPDRDAMIDAGGSNESWQSSYNREEARKAIRRSLFQFRNCYQSELKANSETEGSILFEFEIGTGGKVKTSKIRSSTITGVVPDKGFGQCLFRALNGITFPEPPSNETSSVVYPFRFYRRP